MRQPNRSRARENPVRCELGRRGRGVGWRGTGSVLIVPRIAEGGATCARSRTRTRPFISSAPDPGAPSTSSRGGGRDLVAALVPSASMPGRSCLQALHRLLLRPVRASSIPRRCRWTRLPGSSPAPMRRARTLPGSTPAIFRSGARWASSSGGWTGWAFPYHGHARRAVLFCRRRRRAADRNWTLAWTSAQSVVLTRTSRPGLLRCRRIARLATFRRGRARRLAIHLSIHALEAVSRRRADARTTARIAPSPSSIRASWPGSAGDRARGTLGDDRRRWRLRRRSDRTALILVGPVLASRDFAESALYDPDYLRRFRPATRVSSHDGPPPSRRDPRFSNLPVFNPGEKSGCPAPGRAILAF